MHRTTLPIPLLRFDIRSHTLVLFPADLAASVSLVIPHVVLPLLIALPPKESRTPLATAHRTTKNSAIRGSKIKIIPISISGAPTPNIYSLLYLHGASTRSAPGSTRA